MKRLVAGKKLTDVQISEKGYDFLSDRTYFTGDDGYRNFLIHPKYHPKKLNHMILTLN